MIKHFAIFKKFSIEVVDTKVHASKEVETTSGAVQSPNQVAFLLKITMESKESLFGFEAFPLKLEPNILDKKPVGFRNDKYSCWMNAVMQALLTVGGFREHYASAAKGYASAAKG